MRAGDRCGRARGGDRARARRRKEQAEAGFRTAKEIAELVSTPLVLHGGSGLSDDDFRQAVAGGIAKVNIFTDINMASAKTAHDAYIGAGDDRPMPDITEAVKQATPKNGVFGSPGHGQAYQEYVVNAGCAA